MYYIFTQNKAELGSEKKIFMDQVLFHKLKP